MVHGKHKPSRPAPPPAPTRRDLLTAALAAPLALGPVLPRHPGLDPGSTFLDDAEGKKRWMPDQVRHDELGAGPHQSTTLMGEKWDRALSRYRAAESALAAVTGTEDDDLYDRHLLRFNAALKKLLRTPAPANAALALKLDLTIHHLAWELTGGERCMAALLADAHRLS